MQKLTLQISFNIKLQYTAEKSKQIWMKGLTHDLVLFGSIK